MKHLDSIYKNKWELFYLDDGTVEDSREKNWRDVAWGRVIRIEAHVRKRVHSIAKGDCPGFKAFMHFRWAGFTSTADKLGRYKIRKRIDMWSIGWTDGKTCFYKCIDFKSGELVNENCGPISCFAEHVHPDVKEKVFG